jgi:hypothetical protein
VNRKEALADTGQRRSHAIDILDGERVRRLGELVAEG